MTADRATTGPTSLSAPVVDLVKITRAVYAQDSGTLIVNANSSDRVQIPVLTAQGLGALAPSTVGVVPQTGSFVLPLGAAEPPAFVTVVSANGGRDTEPVNVVPSLAADSPVAAADDTATTDEDTPVTIDVVANDLSTEGLVVPASVAIDTPPANGVALANGDGSVTYTPNLNFNGSDTFTYTVADDAGNVSLPATVTVTVTPVNDAPVAVPDSATTLQGNPVVINLVANDTDVDNVPPTPANAGLTVIAFTNPANGVLDTQGSDQTVEYTPNPLFTGIDTFTYTITDGNGGSATGNVTVTVLPLNQPPVANPDGPFATNEDVALNIPLATLLANDTDPNVGDVLTVTAVGGAVNGTVSIVGTNARFVPALNFFGAAGFSYTVSDGRGGDGGGYGEHHGEPGERRRRWRSPMPSAPPRTTAITITDAVAGQ